MRLRKITVVSVITLRAQGIAKFDTLPNLLLTLDYTHTLNANKKLTNSLKFFESSNAWFAL